MRETVKLIKRKLKAMGITTLSVHKGRGTAVGWTEIHRKSGGVFTEEERKAIREIFGHPVNVTNFFCIQDAEAQMILGLRPKKPICSICGSIHPTEESAQDCWLSH